MGEIIRLENVIKMYDNGRRAINGVNLTIEAGTNAVISGVSGSGKTTLLKLIAGIEVPSDGRIRVDGKELSCMDADTAADFRNRTLHLLTRSPGFMNALTVLENVALPLAIRKVPTKARLQAAMAHMKTLDITYLANARPPQISIMELQLASLARALTGGAKILLIDEMEADLTRREQEKIDDLLYTIWKFGEHTIMRFTDKERGDLHGDMHFSLKYGTITEE